MTYSGLAGSNSRTKRVVTPTMKGIFGGKRRKVTVDVAENECYEDLIKSMIRQSGMSREEFYRSSKRAAKKINMRMMEFQPEVAPAEKTLSK